ncbi:MAG: hypothetical protein PVF63_00115 [Gammaproteobacteria bacterium]
MSDQKSPTFRPPLYHGPNSRNASGAPNPSRRAAGGTGGSTSTEQKGWDAYRKWLSRVSANPARERSTIDHSIYSWKGYNSWADRVKQNWKNEESED